MSQSAPVTAFDNLRRAFAQAYSAADASALADLFTEDAVLIAPDGPNIEGRTAIRAYYQTWFDEFDPTLSITTEEVQVLGELGMGRGAWTATLRPRGGGDPVELEGKYLNLSKPQADGSWRLVRHIWNLPGNPDASS